MNTVTLYKPCSPHVRQIETGFLTLKKQNKINFNLLYRPYDKDSLPTIHLVVANINGVRIAFDLLDGYNFEIPKLENFLENIDVYFKRSCNSEINKNIRGGYKIKPLGLNYLVEYPSLKSKLKKIFCKVSTLLGKNRSVLFPDDIAKEPIYKNDNLTVLYITQLWDPDDVTDYNKKSEREIINKKRIELCRKLKKKSANYVCGLVSSKLALRLAPDLILPNSCTSRPHYIKIMHKSDICITSKGLHDSIGWRFGEYVAASKVILTEDLYYEVPYGFSESINYYRYDSVDMCLKLIDYIIKNPQTTNKMKLANWAYYNRYLKPDMLISSALAKYAKICL